MRNKIIDLLCLISNKNEQWKEISDFGVYTKYYVSNFGRICNQKGYIMKQSLDKYGYSRIMLGDKNGKRKFVSVHRLVAKAFIPNDEKYDCINHKNENKNDNRVENLEWCDRRYNNSYGTRIKRASNSCKKKVQCIETGIIYSSAKDVETDLCINHSHISDCCKGKRKKTGGYSWRYVNE